MPKPQDPENLNPKLEPWPWTVPSRIACNPAAVPEPLGPVPRPKTHELSLARTDIIASQKSAKSRPKVGQKSSKSRPKVGLKSAKSRPKVGQKSAKSQPRVAPKSAKGRPQVGPKSAPSRPRVGPKLAPSRPQVGPELAAKGGSSLHLG